MSNNVAFVTFNRDEFSDLAKTFRQANENILKERYKRALASVKWHNEKCTKTKFWLFKGRPKMSVPTDFNTLSVWWSEECRKPYSYNGFEFAMYFKSRTLNVIETFLDIYNYDSAEIKIAKLPETYSIPAEQYQKVLAARMFRWEDC